MELQHLIDEANEIANEHGWWEKPRSIAETLMLVVTELSEALEEVRANRPLDVIFYTVTGKPEGFPVEIADVFIRLADMIGHHGIGPEVIEAIEQKMTYNRTRPYRHGKAL